MTDTNSTYFSIEDSGDFIKVEVIKLNFPDAELEWDRNSLKTLVSVKAGAFSGKFNADLMTFDFDIFKKEVESIYKDLKGTASFDGMESQVVIAIIGDGIGHLNAKCSVIDYPGIGNKLWFEINIDQTQLPELINQLENIVSKFPVVREKK